ncbi:MAG: nitrite/sulfite reductase [Deltaproteobacteria bacterium]|nr:nitrite/sulfite reductase [Deltaproteobacteria bacterium]
MLFPSDRQLRDGLTGHEGRVQGFIGGSITSDEFRPMRLSYGLYYQLDHTSYMQRIKIPGGLLTVPQMQCLNDIADDYGRGVAHLTTRQDIQIHWVPLGDVGTMYRRLHAVGITTRGACSDGVRNVTACPHSGLLASESFDVSPYAQLINDYFLFNPLNLTLPRKFKISVTNCERDCAQGPINDIGLYAHVRTESGKRVPGFAVAVAGGLGSQPYLATRLRDFVPAEDVLIVSEAILRIQHRLGERKNRSRARVKYLMRKLGADNFSKALDEEVARVEAKRGDELRRETREYVAGYELPAPRHPGAPLAGGDAAYGAWAATNVTAQRDGGYFLVTVTVPIGDYTTAQGRALAALADEHGNGTLRVSNEQNFLLPSISGKDVPAVYRRLVEIGLAESGANHITDVVSCPGADYCSLAVTRSMGMAERIRHHLAESGISAGALGELHVKISGCPNSCGQHHVGDIGLTGMLIKGKDGVERPHYSILLGGHVGEHDHAVGKRLGGRFPEAAAPRAIAAIAECYRTRRAPGEAFHVFVKRVGMDELSKIAVAAAPDDVR